MSKISDVYDVLRTKLAATFPDKTELDDARKVEQNVESALCAGWGVYIGPGNNTNLKLSSKLSAAKTIVVPLTSVVVADDLRTDDKVAAEKALFEDQLTLMKLFENEPQLGQNEDIATLVYVSDQGIESVATEKEKYIKIETTFILQYFENLKE